MTEVKDMIVGYARDPDVRKKAACGGLVTAVIAAAVENGLVDGAVVLKHINEFEGVAIITDDIDKILASAGSLHSVPINMAKYAQGKKVAITLKPCDARAVIEQAKKQKINLDDIYMIGLNCGGSMHPITAKKMLVKMYDINPDDVVGEEIEKGKLIIKTRDGKEKAIPMHDLEDAGFGRRENCRFCRIKIPIIADIACGNWGVIGELAGNATFCEVLSPKGARLIDNAIEAGKIEVQPASKKGIMIREKAQEAMLELGNEWEKKIFTEILDSERLDYYKDALRDCIDCGACKEVCPVCICGEESKCTMFHSLVNNYKLSMYHLTRLLHLSDSCIGCGQCMDVCPSDIPIAIIQQRFSLPVQRKRNYVPGMTMDTPPFLEVKLK